MEEKRSSQLEQDEEDETLSFCDLPIYTDASADKENSSSTSSTSEEEERFFEFSSSRFPGVYQPENIIFCGKLIETCNEYSPTKSRLLQWRKTQLGRMKTSDNGGRGSSDGKKVDRVNGKFLARRGSEARSSRSRRWFMVMFGSMRLPGEMGLADIKNRQSRRRPKALFGMCEDDDDDGRSKLGRRSSANGLIGLVRSLSCRGSYSTGVVET